MTQTPAHKRYPLYSIAIVLLALVAIIYLVAAVPTDFLSEVRFQSLPWWAFPVLIVLHIAYLLLAATMWRLMVGAIAGAHCSFHDAYLQMVTLAIGKYVPGKIWGVVARTAQLHRIGVSARMAIVSSVAEQVVALFAGGIVALGAAAFVFPDYAALIGTAGAVLLLGVVLMPRVIPALVRWVQRRRGDDEETSSIPAAGVMQWLQFIAAQVIMWLLSGALLSIIYFTVFDEPLTTQGVAALVLANTIGFIVGFVAIFAPGGIGVREATTVAVLAPFVPVREALIAAIALRAWIVLFDGINCGVLFVSELRRTAKQLK